MRLNKFKLVLIISFLVCSNAFAETVSVDNSFSEGDQYSSNFATNLNRNFVQMMNGVNNIRGLFAGTLPSSGQIGDGTIGIDNMNDEADPALRLIENFREYVDDGLFPTIDGDLTVDTPAGTAYPEGYRVDKASATSKTYTASMDTYVDIDKNGDFQYSEVSLGASAPAVATNSVRLFKASADGTAVRSFTDLRVTSLVDIGESENIKGLRLSYVSGDQISVAVGYARDDGATGNNYVMELTSATTLDIDSAALNGLDTGSKTSSTFYHVHIVGAQDGGQTVGVVASTNASTPTFLTNYDISRKIGSFYVNSSSQIASFDQVGTSFFYRQPIVDVASGSAQTATSYTPTIPTTAIGAYVGGNHASNAEQLCVGPTAFVEITAGAARGHFCCNAGANEGMCAGALVPVATAQTLFYDQSSGASHCDIMTDGYADNF